MNKNFISKYLIYILIISCITLCGCISNVNVEPTKPWENHYFTVEDFKKSTRNISLDENESIWVLSNTTLSRLLKNTGKIK